MSIGPVPAKRVSWRGSDVIVACGRHQIGGFVGVRLGVPYGLISAIINLPIVGQPVAHPVLVPA